MLRPRPGRGTTARRVVFPRQSSTPLSLESTFGNQRPVYIIGTLPSAAPEVKCIPAGSRRRCGKISGRNRRVRRPCSRHNATDMTHSHPEHVARPTDRTRSTVALILTFSRILESAQQESGALGGPRRPEHQNARRCKHLMITGHSIAGDSDRRARPRSASPHRPRVTVSPGGIGASGALAAATTQPA